MNGKSQYKSPIYQEINTYTLIFLCLGPFLQDQTLRQTLRQLGGGMGNLQGDAFLRERKRKRHPPAAAWTRELEEDHQQKKGGILPPSPGNSAGLDPT